VLASYLLRSVAMCFDACLDAGTPAKRYSRVT